MSLFNTSSETEGNLPVSATEFARNWLILSPFRCKKLFNVVSFSLVQVAEIVNEFSEDMQVSSETVSDLQQVASKALGEFSCVSIFLVKMPIHQNWFLFMVNIHTTLRTKSPCLGISAAQVAAMSNDQLEEQMKAKGNFVCLNF